MTRDDASVLDERNDRCAHPARRVFGWVAYDGTLCAGCCACGEVLAGAADPLTESAPARRLLGEPNDRRKR